MSWNHCLVFIIDFQICILGSFDKVTSLCMGFRSKRAVAGLGPSGLIYCYTLPACPVLPNPPKALLSKNSPHGECGAKSSQVHNASLCGTDVLSLSVRHHCRNKEDDCQQNVVQRHRRSVKLKKKKTCWHKQPMGTSCGYYYYFPWLPKYFF